MITPMTLPPVISLKSLMDPGHNPGRRLSIIVVGAGGIGARLLPTLVKMIPGDQSQILVVDPDIVEPKNIRRQPFLPEHIGEYKAVIMQDRYSTADLPVIAVTEKFNRGGSIANQIDSPIVVLGCVDNTQARWEMLTFATTMGGTMLYLDAGNDGNRGQVIIALARCPQDRPVRTDQHYHLISACDRFPEVFEPEDPKPQGCDLLDTQTPMANLLAATFLLQYLSLYLHGQPLGSCGLTFSALGAVVPIPLMKVRCATGYNEYTAMHAAPPSFERDSINAWIPGLIRSRWQNRLIADAEAAKTKAKPVPVTSAPDFDAAINSITEHPDLTAALAFDPDIDDDPEETRF